MAATISVIVGTSGQTLNISDGGSFVEDIFISKITVQSVGDDVIIWWSKTKFFKSNYANFITPSGSSATAVQAGIAALMQLD